MIRGSHRLAAPLALALALLLTACGGRQAAAPTSAPAPVADAPTRTPRPTREPVAATEEPTAEATAVILSDSTPATTDSALKPVEIGSLSTYTHPSGVFTIDVPDNWTLQDTSKPDEIMMIWTDPSRNGGVFVDIFEDEQAYSESELTDMLTKFLKKTFNKPDLSLEDPTPQADKSVLITWTYTAKADNNVDAPLLGNSFIEQRGNKVSILSMLLPQDQFDALQKQTDDIINTYKITPDAPLSTSGSPHRSRV
jgi:hypothetical protein